MEKKSVACGKSFLKKMKLEIEVAQGSWGLHIAMHCIFIETSLHKLFLVLSFPRNTDSDGPYSRQYTIHDIPEQFHQVYSFSMV